MVLGHSGCIYLNIQLTEPWSGVNYDSVLNNLGSKFNIFKLYGLQYQTNLSYFVQNRPPLVHGQFCFLAYFLK